MERSGLIIRPYWCEIALCKIVKGYKKEAKAVKKKKEEELFKVEKNVMVSYV